MKTLLAALVILSTGIVLDAEADHGTDECTHAYWKAQEHFHNMQTTVETLQKLQTEFPAYPTNITEEVLKLFDYSYFKFQEQTAILETCMGAVPTQLPVWEHME